MTSEQAYVLGHNQAELARLDAQAAMLAPATRTALNLAGIGSGMQVLDIGTGTGGVAFLVAELVGPTGQVVGVDRSGDALEHAERKRVDRGADNVRFEPADLAHDRVPDGPFDAVVARLVLPYLPDPPTRVRNLVSRLAPGAIFLAMEFDMTSVRTLPPTTLAQQMGDLIAATFDAAGVPQTMGPHLEAILTDAGLHSAHALGLQSYLQPGDPGGPAIIHGVISSLLPTILRTGLATADELDVATLRERIAAELTAAKAVLLPPTLVAAWGSAP